MLQYITNPSSPLTVEQQVDLVIDAGCRWIQLYMPDALEEEVRRVVEAIMPKCLQSESFLIMSDRVELAKECNMGGVIVHPSVTPPSQARMTLGAAAVVGVHVDSLADVVAVKALDVDYLMAPLDKAVEIASGMKEQEITLPLVAEGDIPADKVAELREAGVNGIAVSGTIALAHHPAEAVKAYLEAFK